MRFHWLWKVIFISWALAFSGCSNNFAANDFASSGPAASESEYNVDPISISNPLHVKIKAKFYYRELTFDANDASISGLGSVTTSPVAIPFAEFHVFDSLGTQIQRGETDTSGIASFDIPKTPGTYTLTVYSRAYNDYVKVSVLQDTYANQPYSISKDFTIASSDIAAGTKDLSVSTSPSDMVLAQADEKVAPKLEGGAFNIFFDILLANEYIRNQIGKNIMVSGAPSTVANEWWVADKVTVYWKMGFNPRSYFSNDGAGLSFYSTGTNKLYILGGLNGDVKTSDTDHFDDSVILHEYGHFLEDNYGSTGSPGGSHNGNFVIDPRLAWSEGWANYFQAAVLSGASNASNSLADGHIPTDSHFHYYVDTIGYKSSSSDSAAGIGIAFDLTSPGSSSTYDNTAADIAGTGTFRELSISRTLYKSSRSSSETYATGKNGGGISFSKIWMTFSGEDKATSKDRSNPTATSLRDKNTYPIPNAGLFNYLLSQNATITTDWTNILTEEKQKASTADYAFYVDTTASGTCNFSFTGPRLEIVNPSTSVQSSNQQTNNDFFLYYHDGSQSENITLTYTRGGSASLDLDLIIYKKDYIYLEDVYVAAGYNSSSIATQSRRIASLDGGAESVSMAGLTTGWYLINVKVNVYNNNTTTGINGTASYTLTKNGVALCAKER